MQLLIDIEDRIAYLTLNRPEKRNALTPAMLEELLAFLQAAEGLGVRCLVLRGAGGRAFSSGFDMDRAGGAEVQEEHGGDTILDRVYDALEAFPYPVIAAVQGYAVGAGCELTAACDLRIATETARFGMPPAKRGIVYRSQGYRRFIRVMGLSVAKGLFLTGEMVSAREMASTGYIHRVVPEAEFDDAVATMARGVAANAPISLMGSKAILQSLSRQVDYAGEDLAAALAWRRRAAESKDLQEGRQAFRERRQPQFIGE